MGKRANGEGSITKYKDGRWCGRYTVQTPDGPKRKAVYGRTKAEVRVKLTKAMADADNGLVFDAGNRTVKEYLERWLEDSAKGNVGKRTFANYRAQVSTHIVPALGTTKLKTLAPAHVQTLYRQKLDSGLSPASVRYVHAVLHRALKQAVRWGLVPHNAAETVDLPKVTRKEANTLSPGEAKRFLKAAHGDRFETLYVLAVTCGLRQGELLGLRWGDVDLEKRTLRVARQLQRMREGAGLAFLPTKNSKGRIVRLGSTAAEALEKHRERQAEEKLVLGAGYQDHSLVFTTTVGTPVDAQNLVNRSFKPLLNKAGLPDIRFHDLRHTCATLMLSQGVNPKVAQERLGHTDIAVTMNTYSHVLSDMQGVAATAIEDALS